jgi:hypothetical protein
MNIIQLITSFLLTFSIGYALGYATMTSIFYRKDVFSASMCCIASLFFFYYIFTQ